jgi:hypothetical protein
MPQTVQAHNCTTDHLTNLEANKGHPLVLSIEVEPHLQQVGIQQHAHNVASALSPIQHYTCLSHFCHFNTLSAGQIPQTLQVHDCSVGHVTHLEADESHALILSVKVEPHLQQVGIQQHAHNVTRSPPTAIGGALHAPALAPVAVIRPADVQEIAVTGRTAV